MFDKEHGLDLNRLATGQRVTVQGKYDGYLMNMLIKDCVLVGSPKRVETPASPLPNGSSVTQTHILKSECEPSPIAVEVSVEELYVAYKMDKVAADAKFENKTLRVTGVVDRIVVKDIDDIHYIILSRGEKKKEWNVRCTFDKQRAPKLNQLTVGQAVTVQGKYHGYKTNILMRDCVLAH